ncbi:MAG: YfiR family protein [Pseudomonadota bacterium]
MIFSGKLKILWLCLLVLLGGVGPLRAEEPTREYQLKLAFMVNFARFITWPEEAFSEEHSQLAFCVLGKNPFGNSLAGVEGKKVGERTLKVLQLETLGRKQQCQILFISRWETANLAALETSLDRQSIVTVSDIPGFAAAGGFIEFVLKDDKLSFIINNTAMKDRGIHASSSLLNLAAAVR